MLGIPNPRLKSWANIIDFSKYGVIGQTLTKAIYKLKEEKTKKTI